MKRLAPLVALLLLGPASAQAVTFGADLSKPSNYILGCDQYPTPFGIQNTGQSSCTWSSTGSTSNGLAETFVVPGNGTITAMRVKTGPNVGPMQVMTYRSFRPAQLGGDPNAPGNAQVSCCFVREVSATFTPAPNTITEVPVNFAVHNDNVPNSANQLYFDAIGLSVLAPGVPIPGSTADQNSQSAVYYPAGRPGDTMTGNNTLGNLQIMLNAEFTAGGAGGGGGTGGGGGGTTGGATGAALNSTTARVKKGRAIVDLICNGSTACEGQLALINRGAAVPAQRKKSDVTIYGKSNYKIPAGQKKAVKVKLGSKAKRLLKKKRTLKLGVRIKPKAAGATAITGRITLKR